MYTVFIMNNKRTLNTSHTYLVKSKAKQRKSVFPASQILFIKGYDSVTKQNDQYFILIDLCLAQPVALCLSFWWFVTDKPTMLFKWIAHLTFKTNSLNRHTLLFDSDHLTGQSGQIDSYYRDVFIFHYFVFACFRLPSPILKTNFKSSYMIILRPRHTLRFCRMPP